MKTSLDIAKQILEHLSAFDLEKEGASYDLKEFVLYLNTLLFSDESLDKTAADQSNLDMKITHLIVTQSKYFKLYCRDVLHDSVISTPDEFSFLLHLNMVDSYRKMELIHIHLLEAPSGIEVIKRLLNRGLITEFNDPDDKRAKRVKISPEGKELVDKLSPQMDEVYAKMLADLSVKGKMHLASYLKSLNDYHYHN